MTRDSPMRYGIRQLPKTSQLRSSSLDDAVQLARALAQGFEVSAWYRDDATLRLLATNRTNAHIDRG